MVYSCIGGSTLRYIQQQSILPRTFCRYKSITAAIERGRQDGRDGRDGLSRYTTQRDGYNRREGPLKPRHEAKFERFGSPRDRPFSREDGRRSTQQSYTPGHFDRSQPRDNDVTSGYRAENSQGKKWEHRRGSLESAGGGFRGPRPQSKWEDRAPRNDRSSRFDRGGPPRNGEERPPRTGSDGSSRFDRGGPPRNGEERLPMTKNDGSSEYRKSLSKEQWREHVRENLREQPSDIDDDTVSSDEAKESQADGEKRQRGLSWAERKAIIDTTKSPWIRAGGNRLSLSGHLYTVKKPLNTGGPESLPYTTAASQFLYGYNSVLAALKAKRRTFYKLYIHSRATENRPDMMETIRSLKLFHMIQEVGDEYMRAMDKASSGRPHNGVILEASPPPVLPVTSLKEASVQDSAFNLSLDSQSAEEVAINGEQERYEYKSEGWRYPLILYVDGVVDEGNLGAIARSAYVLGVDAIVTPTHHTAEWTSIAVKASAGAAEAISLFTVKDEATFLLNSAEHGWRIYASDSVPWSEISGRQVVYTSNKRHGLPLPADGSPVAEHPTILMMGSEDEGVRKYLRNMAHYKVGIPHGRSSDEVGVDSFNVSVAAGILCYQMMQKPQAPAERDPKNVLF